MEEAFNISIEGFSGPLDLLCSLVESGRLEASHIKVVHLVRLYGAYLARTRHAPADAVAEFFYMVAGLLLEKTRSLLPGAKNNSGDEADDAMNTDMDMDMDEETFMETLERYRPYRAAYLWLTERLERESRSFRRLPDASEDKKEQEKPESNFEKEENFEKLKKEENLEFDIDDLYFLSRVWWGIYEQYTRVRKREKIRLEMEESADWDGFGEPVPDEEQIQTRIAELEAQLSESGVLFLNALCHAACGSSGPAPSSSMSGAEGVKGLVVTLLALLEMCRMGKISIEQEGLFADVRVLARTKSD